MIIIIIMIMMYIYVYTYRYKNHQKSTSRHNLFPPQKSQHGAHVQHSMDVVSLERKVFRESLTTVTYMLNIVETWTSTRTHAEQNTGKIKFASPCLVESWRQTSSSWQHVADHCHLSACIFPPESLNLTVTHHSFQTTAIHRES